MSAAEHEGAGLDPRLAGQSMILVGIGTLMLQPIFDVDPAYVALAGITFVSVGAGPILAHLIKEFREVDA